MPCEHEFEKIISVDAASFDGIIIIEKCKKCDVLISMGTRKRTDMLDAFLHSPPDNIKRRRGAMKFKKTFEYFFGEEKEVEVIEHYKEGYGEFCQVFVDGDEWKVGSILFEVLKKYFKEKEVRTDRVYYWML